MRLLGAFRLYGEEFEVVSDPFPEADGVAVHVTTKKDPRIRLLRIPVTVLQGAVVKQGDQSSMDKP
jgi:hypothetical protein